MSWGSLVCPEATVLTGDEIQQMDDQALMGQVERVNLFCRVTPVQKNRVILALKRRGRVVGYLGDGINDAPSLHSADIGFSVDTAVDVAKDAADMIMLERDLNVIADGVVEGRRTFGNIMKYIMMGTSSNFGNMFSMAGASVFLPFLPMLPVQILLNNLLYDVSEIPIPLDNVDEEYLVRPRQWDMRLIRNFMLILGPVSSIFDFLTFYVMLKIFHAGEALFHTGWFIESMATQVLVIFIIRTQRNPLKSRPNKWLIITSLVIVAIAVLLPLTPYAAYLGFVAPPFLFYRARRRHGPGLSLRGGGGQVSLLSVSCGKQNRRSHPEDGTGCLTITFQGFIFLAQFYRKFILWNQSNLLEISVHQNVTLPHDFDFYQIHVNALRRKSFARVIRPDNRRSSCMRHASCLFRYVAP